MNSRFSIAASCLFAFLAFACGASADGPSADEDVEAALEHAAEDDSFELFIGKWVNVKRTVPSVGSLAPEYMVRSLEFTRERADTPRYARRRMIEVVRPDCGDCRDDTLDRSTYRSVASSENPKKGKLYTTEGGNTTSADEYEVSEDGKELTLTGHMGDGSRVTREFRKQAD